MAETGTSAGGISGAPLASSEMFNEGWRLSGVGNNEAASSTITHQSSRRMDLRHTTSYPLPELLASEMVYVMHWLRTIAHSCGVNIRLLPRLLSLLRHAGARFAFGL